LAQAAVGGAHPGALVFHGADPAGARQRAAEVLRRALLDAGYTVLTVEHPGYGESPPPGAADPKSVWDPLATGQAALELLTSLPRVAGIYLVGHSMGTVDVIRLLGRQPNVDGAILFGAGMHDPPGQLSEYWYERFHKDRRLTYRLSRTEVIELQRLYYDDRALLGLLAADHPPIVFARFEKEWRNIASTREEVYGLLPGRKRAWDIANSSHYFSVFSQSGLLLGDTRVARALVRRFAELHDPDRDTARTDAAKALSSL
jgi:pimeloyl-ACP methyl ester carboxylesterase